MPERLLMKSDPTDIRRLTASWRRHLDAANLSERTIETYTQAVAQLTDFLEMEERPTAIVDVDRAAVEAFIVHQRDTKSAATANNRYRALQQFFRWLCGEQEIETNPFDRMRPPKIEEHEVPVIAVEDFRKLMRACAGTAFEDRRDTALIGFLLDTGARLAEVAGLQVDHIDLDNLGVAVVLGKGRRDRTLPMSPTVIAFMDRYERARDRHPLADSPWWWIGRRGQLTGSGIRQVLRRRCKEAGIDPVHPHQLRHSFAHYFLAAGGNETDLMRLAGWLSRQMVARYGASAADERARQAHKQHSPLERLL